MVVGALVIFVELGLFAHVERLGLRVVGRLWAMMRLRDEFGADRLMLGDGLRVGVLTEVLWRERTTVFRLIWVLDRDGLLMRGRACCLGVAVRVEIELRLLRVGMDRCGVGRETALELDGLGADRVVCLLLCPLARLRLLLRALRFDDWASATTASNKTPATAKATTAVPGLDIFFFTRNIIRLLSPAICFSGNPGLPFPHHRRYPTRHVRSCDI